MGALLDLAKRAGRRTVATVTCPQKLAADVLPDPAAKARRQRVLAMLAERPGTRYAVVVDNPDTDPVIVTLAIRGVGTCELAIPAAKFDAFMLLELLDRAPRLFLISVGVNGEMRRADFEPGLRFLGRVRRKRGSKSDASSHAHCQEQPGEGTD